MSRTPTRWCPLCKSADCVQRVRDWICKNCGNVFDQPERATGSPIRHKSAGSGQKAGRAYRCQLAESDRYDADAEAMLEEIRKDIC